MLDEYRHIILGWFKEHPTLNTDFHTDKIPLNYETAHGRKMSFRLFSHGIAVS